MLFRRDYSGENTLPEQLDALLVAAYFGHSKDFKNLFWRPEFTLRKERALTWACRLGRLDIVKFSVENGTNYVRDRLGRCVGQELDDLCAFSWAVAEGFLDIIEFLLEKDSSVINIQTSHGASPLMIAVEKGNLPVVRRLLIAQNIDVNLSDIYGRRAVHAAITGLAPAATQGEMIQILLDRSELNLTPRDHQGRTVLWFAADRGNKQAVKMLLRYRRRQEYQEDIDNLLDDYGDLTGQSPLHRAAFYGYDDIIEMLCETKKVQHQLESVDNLNGANVFDVAATRGKAGAIDVLGHYYPSGVNHRDLSGNKPGGSWK